MAFQLPELKYSYDALEPYIDAKTMELHHSKHHKTYIDRFNAAIAGKPEWESKSAVEIIIKLDSVPADIKDAVRNNGGGAINHSLYWEIIGPKAGGEAIGAVGESIKKVFGSFASFKEKFTAAATTQFGSGWAWLVLNHAGELEVQKTPNQDTPLSKGEFPILGIDVWEHAYYLKYQNRRPEYIEAFYNVINWERVNDLYLAAKDSGGSTGGGCGCGKPSGCCG